MSYRIKNQQQQQQQQPPMNFQNPPTQQNTGPKAALPIMPGYGGGKAPSMYPPINPSSASASSAQQPTTGMAPMNAAPPPPMNPQWAPSAPPSMMMQGPPPPFQQQQQQPGYANLPPSSSSPYGQQPPFQQQQQPPRMGDGEQSSSAFPTQWGASTTNPTGGYGQPMMQSQPFQQQQQQAAPASSSSSTWQSRPKAQFFADVKGGLTRDYILIIDKSGSMNGPRWQAARAGVAMLAPEICKCDPDGATVYFFSSYGKISKYEHVRDANMVMQLFDREIPSGTTDLAGVLTAALNDHFNPQRVGPSINNNQFGGGMGGGAPSYSPGHAPTTILVITDGEPDDKGEVIQLLVQAANCLERDEELSVSFIQVGEDDAAMQFLKLLDDGLVQRGARFDIVDAISSDKMQGVGFEQLIWYSIHD